MIMLWAQCAPMSYVTAIKGIPCHCDICSIDIIKTGESWGKGPKRLERVGDAAGSMLASARDRGSTYGSLIETSPDCGVSAGHFFDPDSVRDPTEV